MAYALSAGDGVSRARSTSRASRRDFSIILVVGCALPSTRRAIRSISSFVATASRRSSSVAASSYDDVDAYAIWLTAMISMYGVGYPIGHTAVIGWFSKAMKNKPQGFLLGIFGSAGSLARIVFPIVTGFVATHFSADAVFGVLATLLGTTLAILVVHRAAFREAIA